MPFCDIDTDVSLYYVTNSPGCDATDLDSKKQTIILIPPIFGSADFWLREQFKDPRLSQHYNLVGIDQRNMGSTKSPLCPERDAWVDAADIAMLHELLQLPPCHIFAAGLNASQAAMKFAVLFPGKCLSLCLCPAPVQAGEDPEWLQQAYFEFLEVCCFPKDLETLERACMELLWSTCNGVKMDPELEDEIVAWWQINMPPTKRGEFLAQFQCTSQTTLANSWDPFISSPKQRASMSDEELASIKSPALFIQGERSIISPHEKAMELCEKLPDGRVVVIKGGPQISSFLPEYASLVNRFYCQFLSTIPNSTGTEGLLSPPILPDTVGVCKAGLARLALLSGDPSIADRTPSTTLSFSRLSPELVAQNTVQLEEFTKGQNEAFNPLDEDGRPIRKFSERHQDEWEPEMYDLKQSAQGQQLVTAVVETSTTLEEPQ